jgi:hypothetical protein
MSKFCLAEIAVLLIGWVSNVLFLLYSRNVFAEFRYGIPTDPAFLHDAAILAFPYAFTFVICCLLRRFVKAFLLLSLVLTIGSICAYYGAYLGIRTSDPLWIFQSVPFWQTVIAASFAFVVFLVSLVPKPKPVAA